MALRSHPVADQGSERVVADIDRERRPVGVDQRDAAAGAHDPHHLGDRGCGVGEPLERAFGPHGVEGIVGLVEGARIADGEAHATTRASGVGTGDAQHALGRVDADDLPAFAEILGERERCLPEAAAHVEQSFTRSEAEMCSLPRPQPERRVPSGGSVHRGEEHVDVRIIVDPLVAEPVRVLRRHAARVRVPLTARARNQCHVRYAMAPSPSWRAFLVTAGTLTVVIARGADGAHSRTCGVGCLVAVADRACCHADRARGPRRLAAPGRVATIASDRAGTSVPGPSFIVARDRRRAASCGGHTVAVWLAFARERAPLSASSPQLLLLRSAASPSYHASCRDGVRPCTTRSHWRPEMVPSAGYGGPARNAARSSRAACLPLGNWSSGSNRQAATIARTRMRHSSSSAGSMPA